MLHVTGDIFEIVNRDKTICNTKCVPTINKYMLSGSLPPKNSNHKPAIPKSVDDSADSTGHSYLVDKIAPNKIHVFIMFKVITLMFQVYKSSIHIRLCSVTYFMLYSGWSMLRKDWQPKYRTVSWHRSVLNDLVPQWERQNTIWWVSATKM